MPGNQKPNIAITRIKMSMPQGYMLGRTSPGTGPVELIPIAGGTGNSLGNQLVATGSVGSPITAQVAQLSYFIGQEVAKDQVYPATLAPGSATFPSGFVADIATCRVAPATEVVFYVVTNYTSYANSGYSSGVVATITFAAAATTGVVAWLADPTTIAVDTVVYLIVARTVTDTAMRDVQIKLAGDYTNG